MSRLAYRPRRHERTPEARALLITVVAVAMASLFLTAYSLALGDPVPHDIQAALVGAPAADPRAVAAAEKVTDGKLEFRRFGSIAAARRGMNHQNVYAALDLGSSSSTLYVASAAGASVARVLQKIDAVDPSVRVVDTNPLAPDDPNGLDIFYLMLVATIAGMVTVFQVRGQAPGLELRHHISFVIGLALLASTVLTLVDGPLLHRPAALYPEEWGIVAVHVLAVASFASLMAVVLGPWAIVPSWSFFVILGNASSGGAVAPPLLPQPFAFLSQWLPSGATVNALRDATYFQHYQLARPLVVLGVWGAGLFLAWVLLARRRQAAVPRTAAVTPPGGADGQPPSVTCAKRGLTPHGSPRDEYPPTSRSACHDRLGHL